MREHYDCLLVANGGYSGDTGATTDSANLAADPSTFIPQADQRGS